MPSVDELRALAAVLPPNLRVSGSEVADVLSAALAVGHYGEGLLKAAAAGIQAVHDELHQHAVKQAKDSGDPEPVQSPTLSAPSDPLRQQPPTVAVTRGDLEAFKRELLGAVRGEAKARVPDPDTTPEDFAAAQQAAFQTSGQQPTSPTESER